MTAFANFNDDGECIAVVRSKAAPSAAWSEVPEHAQPADIWISKDGDLIFRDDAAADLPDAIDIGTPLTLPAFPDSWWTLDGAMVSDGFAPANSGVMRLRLHGRYRLEHVMRVCSYVERRVDAYPTIGDQLDMIYHQGVGTWRGEIAAVKARFPKPSES